MAETHTYEFNVSMSCGGCSGAIDRVLKKLDGTSSSVSIFQGAGSPLAVPRVRAYMIAPVLSPPVASRLTHVFPPQASRATRCP
jgi:hypothetical protein